MYRNALLSPAPATPVLGTGVLQRTCACGNHTVAGGECAECEKNKRVRLQTNLMVNEPGDIYEQEADRIAGQVMAAPAHPAIDGGLLRIQRLAPQPANHSESAPVSIDRALASPGRPLEPEFRQEMELRFGYDFSQVRVHTGVAAEQSARDVNAHAYTVGRHMVFGTGRFTPATHAGRHLLAHELTHVVQQASADPVRSDTRNERAGRDSGTALPSPPTGGAVARRLQRQPAPPGEIEMPAEWAFAADSRKRTWRRYARSLGQQDAARIRKTGKLTSRDREEVNAKLRFFESEAMWAYIAEVKPALVEVTREEIEMPPEYSPSAIGELSKAASSFVATSAFFERMLAHPNYIDNDIKMVEFYTAELAIVRYKDGSSLRLGLVPRWMEPPVVEVDYHTPPDGYSIYHDAKGTAFFRQADLLNIPRGMPYGEMQKQYLHRVDFFAEGKSGRIVPSRVNTLTAPTLCKVLLDSEKQYVEQVQWVAEWGIEVAKVIPGMGAGGYGGRSVVEAEVAAATRRIAARRAASGAVKKLTEEMENLFQVGGSKTITVAGVKFEDVVIARQGSRLAVRRFRIERVAAPPGQGSVLSEAFEDAAAAVARKNGLKTVTIDVGIIVNPGWREWLESLGYVYTAAEGGWIKTITL